MGNGFKLIPVVEDPRIEEVPCTDGVYDSNMGTPRYLRDWNITALQDVSKSFPSNPFNSSLAGRIVHSHHTNWVNRRLIGEVAAAARNETRTHLGIQLPGIGYDDYISSTDTVHTVNTSMIDSWLAWNNPRGQRYCGDISRNDFAAKTKNLKSWL